jgi:hypothetical protein
MLDTVPSTLLTLAGLLALLGALAGALLWVDGKPVAQVQSTKIRWVLGVAGLALIATGVWLEHARDKTEPLETLEKRIKALEEKTQSLEAETKARAAQAKAVESRMNTVDHSFVGLRAQTTQLTEDARRLGLRAAVAAAEHQPECDGSRDARRSRRWVDHAPVDSCERAINSMWTIDIVVGLEKTADDLKAKLAQTGIPIFQVPMEKGAGKSDKLLGIVFPDGAPHDLICAVRDKALESSSKLVLGAAMTVSTYLRLSGDPVPSYSIQVGVPMASVFEGGSALESDEWSKICSPDMSDKQFEEYLDEKAKSFRLKADSP